MEATKIGGRDSSRGDPEREAAERTPAYAASAGGYRKLEDGTAVAFRPLSADDAVALGRFHGRLSRRSVYLRYFTGLARPPSEEKVGSFANLEGRDGFALVALDPAHCEEIIALVFYVRDAVTGRFELACLVEDGWQGKGLGLGLARELVKEARRQGIGQLRGVVLPENTRMLNLLRDLELPKRTYLKHGLVHVELDLETE